MGTCLCTSSYYDDNHSAIEKNMNAHSHADTQVKKLLLLGSGSSGKSTLFKQLKCIHGEGFDNEELEDARHIIRQNVVAGMKILLKKSLELYESDKHKYKQCYVDFNDNIEDAARCVIRHAQDSFVEETLPDQMILKNLGNALGLLWDLPPIRKTYALRGDNYSFPDNMDFFLNISEIIFSDTYMPTEVHALKTRIRTCGIIEVTYEIKENIFNIYDVGGQRNERKKWIHSFENVTAVIFVAALNHYNAVLFEDEKKNAMHESLELFDEICNSKWFRQTEMIIFLNKNDLFIETLREGHSLSKCFNNDGDWMGEVWQGPDYHMQEDINKDNEYFEYCYDKAKQFIRRQYVDQNRNAAKFVFTHVTQATSMDNVKQVFWDVQNIIIRSNLKKGGFLP